MIDLHTHTNYSDGTWSVEKLLKEAQQTGVEMLAITDHDTVKAHLELKEKDYSKIDFDSNELNTTAQNYITEHYDEISKVVQKEGENAALIKVFDEIAPTLYQTMTDTYKKAPTKKLTSTVTLEKKDDKWIITGLDE